MYVPDVPESIIEYLIKVLLLCRVLGKELSLQILPNTSKKVTVIPQVDGEDQLHFKLTHQAEKDLHQSHSRVNCLFISKLIARKQFDKFQFYKLQIVYWTDFC